MTEAIDMDDIDEAIQDAICDDEGRLRAKTLLHHLNKRGLTIAPAVRRKSRLEEALDDRPIEAPEAHDYPRPIERLGPIIPGRTPRDHVHRWSWNFDGKPGTVICRECGHTEEEAPYDEWKDA